MLWFNYRYKVAEKWLGNALQLCRTHCLHNCFSRQLTAEEQYGILLVCLSLMICVINNLQYFFPYKYSNFLSSETPMTSTSVRSPPIHWYIKIYVGKC